MKKQINEIAMIDAACMALAAQKDVLITINYCLYRATYADEYNGTHTIAGKVTAHRQFVIMDPSFEWAVEPAIVHYIHMNRRIKPWPVPFEYPK